MTLVGPHVRVQDVRTARPGGESMFTKSRTATPVGSGSGTVSTAPPGGSFGFGPKSVS